MALNLLYASGVSMPDAMAITRLPKRCNCRLNGEKFFWFATPRSPPPILSNTIIHFMFKDVKDVKDCSALDEG